MREPNYNHYIIFLPNGEVITSEEGVPPVYRVDGTVVRGESEYGPSWYRWCPGPSDKTPTWEPLPLEKVPNTIRTRALILGL